MTDEQLKILCDGDSSTIELLAVNKDLAIEWLKLRKQRGKANYPMRMGGILRQLSRCETEEDRTITIENVLEDGATSISERHLPHHIKYPQAAPLPDNAREAQAARLAKLTGEIH